MSAHAFVDETKDRGYLLAAAIVLPSDARSVRCALSSLVLPGQRRIHFTREADPRRRQIADVLVQLPVEVMLYDSSRWPRREQRDECLRHLVTNLAKRGACRLVIEQDDSIIVEDKRVLYESVRKSGCADTLTYLHQRPHEECLLAIPDAVAWCWTKRGHRRKRVRPIVGCVRTL